MPRPLAHPQHSLIKPHLLNLSGSSSWMDGVVIERNLALPNTDMDSAVVAERHMIVIHTRNPTSLEWRIDGRQKKSTFSEGDVIVAPADLFVDPHWKDEVEMLLLSIRSDVVNQIAAEMDRPDNIELIPHFQFRDELLEQLVRSLSAEFEQDLPPNRVYVESLVHTLIAHLLSRYSVAGLKQPAAGKGLPSKKLALVKDYIDAHIGESISLEAIAAMVELSPSYFIKLFKQSTGSAPHQYVITRRLEKAKELLSRTQTPIADIACQTGFSDQSHLTRLMRRHAGLTPKTIRNR